MPIIALDSEGEYVDEVLDLLEDIFRPKKITYIEKRGQHVVTIPRTLTKDEQKRVDGVGAGKYPDKDLDKSETKPQSVKKNESNAQNPGA